MNNIVIIAVNRDNLLQYCLPSVEHFAGKYNVDIDIIKDKKYNLFSGSRYDYTFFERFQAYGFVQDRTLVIDSDIVFSPDCPDVFGLFPEGKIYGLIEDWGRQKEDRRRQIKNTQRVLGDRKWKKVYLNAGVLLLDQAHKELFNVTEKYLQEAIKKGLSGFEDQNLINWRIRDLNYKVGNLGLKFNHIPFYRRGNAREAFIVHFAGNSFKEREMKKLYEYWYK